WAGKKFWNRIKGHYEGANSVDKITSFCRKARIKYLTLYAFSTENWNRPEDEVSGLMTLLREFLDKKRTVMLENRIRFNIIGSLNRFPEDILKRISDLCRDTSANNPVMTLTLALSYGSRTEIVEAVKKICLQTVSGKINVTDIDEKLISSSLFTHDIPDPDLVIRTSGEIRISNFLLWQIAYSELYFTDILWPDFKEEDIVNALKDFAGRERRFGKTTEQIKKKELK
ncbi:MAG TPA: polyprenyl diphosphate synthase, partial [bacterium]|nr:polyprenyl diphosphate synthase [bacterium]